MRLSETRKGELSALSGALLWSAFPVLTTVTVATVPPLYAAAVATAVSSVFFACVMTVRGLWHELKLRSAWRDMLLATLLIGIVFYGMIFAGFRLTTPGNGAVVGLMEIPFTFLIVNMLWKHEAFVATHAAGAVLMACGALLILLPGWRGGLHSGDVLIFAAAAVPPVGNIFAQRARRAVSGETLMLVRSGIGCVFLFGLALLLDRSPAPGVLADAWWKLLINGVFLLGLSKILWLEAIHRIPIAKTLALSAAEVFVTFLLAYVFLHQAITLQQVLSVIPMLCGLALLVRK